jgi:type IX secretion system PorP/SprF family membrane protein
MKKFAIGIFMFAGLQAGAQQMQQMSQYLLNPYLINPAAAGLTDFVDMNLSFRQQWVGFDNSPQTYYFSANSVVGRVGSTPKYSASLRTSRSSAPKNTGIRTGKMRHAVGGNMMVDTYGAFRRNVGNVSYAIHLPITKGMNIAVGVGVGVSNFVYFPDKVTMLNQSDNTYSNFLGNTTKKNLLDLVSGVYLYTENLLVGYSNAQMVQNDISFGSPTESRLYMHHFLMAGYRIDVNDQLSITPNVLLKYMNPAPMAIDLSCKFDVAENFFGGVSYRHKDAVVGIVGIMWNNFKIGYSYDYTLSALRKLNSGGHEIVLGYKVKI